MYSQSLETQNKAIKSKTSWSYYKYYGASVNEFNLSEIWDKSNEFKFMFCIKDKLFINVFVNKATDDSGTYLNGYYYSSSYYATVGVTVSTLKPKTILRETSWGKIVPTSSNSGDVYVYYR